MAEKQQLANDADLTMKQVNDWFTNYRKRHWEEELDVAGAQAALRRAELAAVPQLLFV